MIVENLIKEFIYFPVIKQEGRREIEKLKAVL